MARKTVQARLVWSLAEAQHGVITRLQLLELGYTRAAIAHRLDCGRLHRIHRGVYALGRPTLTREGFLMAAVLSCGAGAALSHWDAGGHWRIWVPPRRDVIEVSVAASRRPHRPGITVHRRAASVADAVTVHDGIPVTTPALTLVDLAPRLSARRLERAVDEADKLNLIDPETLRLEVERWTHLPGGPKLIRLLDRTTFRLTDSELERLFLPLARRAGLSVPLTRKRVNGFRVDFHWPALGLVVETDGLRYHRTPAAQARDRVRDQQHLAAGTTCLRFTHYQVKFEPERVVDILRAVAARLRG